MIVEYRKLHLETMENILLVGKPADTEVVGIVVKDFGIGTAVVAGTVAGTAVQIVVDNYTVGLPEDNKAIVGVRNRAVYIELILPQLFFCYSLSSAMMGKKTKMGLQIVH
jgi:hypothetical protein